MKSIHIQKTLRSTRLAFLVNPNHTNTLKQIFALNTSLWGGMFNPIIPVYSKTPEWWEDHPKILRSPFHQYVNNYINTFEPDYLVSCINEPTFNITFPKERIISINEILAPAHNGHETIRYGLDVHEIYERLYHEEFKFERVQPVHFYIPKSKHKSEDFFITSVFGYFGKGAFFQNVKNTYENIFKAKELEIDRNNYFQNLLKANSSPLWVGRYLLKARQQYDRHTHLHWIDLERNMDIIDFWNLRAQGFDVIPIPIQWANALQPHCKNLVDHIHKPLRYNKDMFAHTVLCARDIRDNAQLSDFCKSISKERKPNETPSVFLAYYPRMWERHSFKHAGIKCHIESEQSTNESQLSDDGITIDLLSPKLIERKYVNISSEWVTAIRISDYSNTQATGLCFPSGIKALNRLFKSVGIDRIHSTSEGVVVHCGDIFSRCYWTIPTGLSLFKQWLSELGYKCDLSGVGRLTSQLISTIGSIRWHTPLSNRVVLDELNHMAVSQPAIARVRPVGHWHNILKSINHNDGVEASKDLKWLTDKGVLRVGMTLKCEKCSQSTWFSVEDIDDSVKCERCLTQFAFPAHKPPPNPWSYRPYGIFNVENFVNGGYVVYLSIKFMLTLQDSSPSWCPSIEIVDSKDEKMEIDYLICMHEVGADARENWIFFGESKSYNEFKQVDVSRAKQLAKRFPGVTLVFSTLRDSLTSREKALIAPLARKSRIPKRNTQQNQIIVLTGTELFSQGITECWKQKLGSHYALHMQQDFSLFCEKTQMMHLDMESFSETRDKHYQKSHRKKPRAP